ncbi:PorT family protein [Weeksellaceae bacterium TAE3-ERU29]|nr:PorT family protein [Weeksellaceae bacterium TAE3-ERU29]
MRNLVLSVIIAFAGIAFTNAQSLQFGVRGGYNYSNLRGETSSKLDLKAKNGYHIGIFTELPLSSKMSIQPEILYSTQGASNVFQEGDELKTQNINIPVLFKYYLVEGFNFQVGPQVSFNTGSEYDFNKSGADKLWNDVKTGDTTKGLNYGAVFGLGYKVPIIGITLDARYALGLNNIINTEDNGLGAVLKSAKETDLKNGVFSLGVGYQF